MKAHTNRKAVLCGLGALLLTPAFLDAQSGTRTQTERRSWFRGTAKFSKSSPAMLRAFRPVVAAARAATVRIEQDGRLRSLGTIVSESGLVLAISNQLKEKEGSPLVGRLPSGKRVPVRILARDEPSNLALLALEVEKDVDFSFVSLDRAHRKEGVRPGSFVASVGTGEDPIAIGIMSTELHSREIKKGYLGVRLDQKPGAIRLTEITKKSGAERAGLKVGDVMLMMDGRRLRSNSDFVVRIGAKRPGAKIELRILRAKKELELTATLGAMDRMGRRMSQERMWGALSQVRIGFSDVLQHDSVLRPEQCGGPLVNLDGEVVGINVSRPERVQTLAHPARALPGILASLLKAAHVESALTPAKQERIK